MGKRAGGRGVGRKGQEWYHLANLPVSVTPRIQVPMRHNVMMQFKVLHFFPFHLSSFESVELLI